MDFESDPAAEFLSRERQELGDLEGEIIASNAESTAAEALSSDDFEMINSDVAAETAGDNDDLAGMTFNSSVTTVYEVPEKIKKWREEQAVRLEEKDQDEKKTIEKLKESAAKELSDWYTTYRDSKEKTKVMNRKDEKELSTSETNGTTNDDAIWEKISSLCDFGVQTKNAPKNGRDVTRMRSIFLQLKSSPPAKNI